MSIILWKEILFPTIVACLYFLPGFCISLGTSSSSNCIAQISRIKLVKSCLKFITLSCNQFLAQYSYSCSVVHFFSPRINPESKGLLCCEPGCWLRTLLTCRAQHNYTCLDSYSFSCNTFRAVILQSSFFFLFHFWTTCHVEPVDYQCFLNAKEFLFQLLQCRCISRRKFSLTWFWL